MSALRDEARGTLRVSAPASFAVTLLAPLLGAFQARYPAVQIDLDMNDRYADLVAGRIDVAIRIGMLEDSSLVARRLANCAHAIYGARRIFASGAFRSRRRICATTTASSTPTTTAPMTGC
ncbi:LysR substrate-binding domain-containing protein [Ralstonia sp. TCR112]|uniref:LysR substrate-binding domain-containing protein n=1 Tax=Ralstonia sp. TCR112 TaxID=2601730 RepID=UPI0021C3514F|nr:LysR substrate-binding domain-containing protein [Ralstonia sp. TCR112]